MVVDKKTKEEILRYLSEIEDPEIPVISIVDLGVIRNISSENDELVVEITPTYTGCPAMELMEKQVVEKLQANGYLNVSTRRVFSPAWTTDWITEEAKEKLRKYGIAPPHKATADKGFLTTKETKQVSCPRCSSSSTIMQSAFGSTPCKALYKCNECLETFDYFKCI